ncbi:MAG TPA: hypothetical protein VLK84_05525 [Longimicrobium sp.]|nr:hypothetical protein [Longimicrobium sp.]
MREAGRAAGLALGLLLMVCAPRSLRSQPPADQGHLSRQIPALLEERGFEGVAALQDSGDMFVMLENRHYRDEQRALREAAALILPTLGTARGLVLVPLHRGLPIAQVRFAPCGEPGSAGGKIAGALDLDVSGLPPRLRSTGARRPRLVIHPWIEARFGIYEEIAWTRTGIAPELQLPLRPGMLLSAQVLAVLQDELYPGEAMLRPVRVTLNQTVRLHRNLLASATAGTFTGNRYGGDLEVRALDRRGRWSAGVELGLTGESFFGRSKWWFNAVDSPLALADLEARLRPYSLVLRATGGVFTDGDTGMRVDVLREFGEFEIGWYVLRTTAGSNGGFTIRIPLPPPTHARIAGLVVQPADAFRWEYRYRSLTRAGRRYDTGNRLGEFPRRLDAAAFVGADAESGSICPEPSHRADVPGS